MIRSFAMILRFSAPILQDPKRQRTLKILRTERVRKEMRQLSLISDFKKMSEYFQHYGILSHCAWISVISVFPLIYCGLFFAIKNTIITDEARLVQPNMMRVTSSGPAAELYPDSLGEYKLLPDITHNDLPVFQHSARDDRFIIQNGNCI